MTVRELLSRASRQTMRAVRALTRLAQGHAVRMVGGPARARVIVMLGAVLGLSSADAATVGAAAPQLEQTLHIGNAGIGLLSSAALLAGALLVIPVGVLVDHVRRVPLLAIGVALWSVAALFSGLAGSYGTLLLTRLALGAITATAGPAIASLTGDYFPAEERGRVYAYILGGEIAGAAGGFIIGGTVASAISWRAAFVLLALPGFWLARSLWRTLPEPARGGQSRLYPGALHLDPAFATSTHGEAPLATGASGHGHREHEREGESPSAGANASASADASASAGDTAGAREDVGNRRPPAHDGLAAEAVRGRGVTPNPRLILGEDPRTMPLGRVIRYILSIPSYALLVISSSLGYFFFAGLQTFVLLFVRGHYHVSQVTAELIVMLLVLGGLLGTLVSGRLTDRMLRHGLLAARVWVPAFCYLGAVVLLVPGVLGHDLTPALWFDLGATALIAAANPPLEAARLDIMPAGLWGRAEAVRSVLRSLAQALAPLSFGALADLISGIAPEQAPIGTHPSPISPSAATGLEVCFLIMLSTLAAAGVFLLRARRSYPGDVATAAAGADAAAAGAGAAAANIE
jgi:predicted MFS family arabinose efflux permease